MANFAIAADENVIARGNKLIEELQEPGEKKGVTLNRLFDLVSTHLQENQLKRSGVDTEALDASITNIRNLFTAALSGKEEIRTEYERRMAELRERNEELEKNYKIKLGKLSSEKEEALRKYNDLKELQETAETARKAAEEQVASAVNLAKEKDKTNIMLMEKLRDAEQKAANYDTLEEENASLKQDVSNLQFKIKDYEKNEILHIREIEQLAKEKERDSATIEKLNIEKSEAQETIQSELSKKTALLSKQEKELNTLHIQLTEQTKEAELMKERAVIEKEREMISKIEHIALVDAILAKKNLGTTMDMAPITIGLGPGFCAGKDVHVVIETMRGHNLGRLIYEGCALPNTGVPGNIKGYSKERVIHSPCAGVCHNVKKITDIVEMGEIIAYIDKTPVYASMSGLLRGLIQDGYNVTSGFKMADIDPRVDEYQNCFTISDKARCIAGGVLEAILHGLS